MSTGEDNKSAFRRALGAFATGVTIVTTADEAGQPVGVTASSFNSVSLDPPLVLWSLGKNALSRDAFSSSGHFAIHILAASQEAVSNKFARSGSDKFAEVPWDRGALGSPLLREHAAVFECRTRHEYEGGDHIIFVGEVVAFEERDEAPLLFHGGRYAEHRPRPPAGGEDTVDLDHARFSDDFLLYLIARASFQIARPARQRVRELGLDQEEHATLVALSMDAPAGCEDIQRMLEHTGNAPSREKLDAMASGGLLTKTQDGFVLAREGRDKLIEILAVGKAFESDVVAELTPGELAETKRLLRRLIDLTGKDVPLTWRTL